MLFPTEEGSKCEALLPLCRAVAVQQFTHFAGEIVLRKWLAEQMHARVEPPVVNDGVSGIAGREQHRQVRTPGESAVGKLTPAHSGKNDVGKQEVDARSRLEKLQPHLRIAASRTV